MSFQIDSFQADAFQSLVTHPPISIPMSRKRIGDRIVSVYIDFTDEMIKRFCPKEENEKFNAFLKEESRMLCESTTQDLAAAIYNRLKNRA